MPVDDGEQEATPVAEVIAAVAWLRMAAESTGEGMAMDQPGWRYVSNAYRLLGQLPQLAEVLPQLLVGIRDSVTHELELNLIAMDVGSPYQGRPDAAVQEMADGIDTAVAAARELSSGVAAAADALTWAAYGGRRIDLFEGVPQVAVWKALARTRPGCGMPTGWPAPPTPPAANAAGHNCNRHGRPADLHRS